MIEELEKIQKIIEEAGEHPAINVITSIWINGGGAPVYLEDVIEYLKGIMENE